MPNPFHFELLREDHLPLLCEWLQRPHVAEWWGEAEPIDEMREWVAEAQEPRGTRMHIAHKDVTPIGFIQVYCVMDSGDGWWEDETDPGARGIDQFLADGRQLGQGLGSAMVRAFVQGLWADPAVTVVQTDPSPHNTRAIRAYEKAGFAAVGEVITPDGPALLMRCARPT